MTNEEAKVFMLQFNTDKRLNPSEHEAVRVAIKALEQEPKETWSIKDVATTFERHGLMTEQEPCDDCISRAELLKAVDTWDKFGCDADTKLVPVKDCYVPYIHYDDVVKAIKGMPSVQPKTEWIPVSERLPEDFQRVLVTIVNYKGDKVVRVAEYYNRKGVFQIKENHEQWEVGEEGLLAWMPIPESYKSESEDKE